MKNSIFSLKWSYYIDELYEYIILWNIFLVYKNYNITIQIFKWLAIKIYLLFYKFHSKNIKKLI